MQETGNLCPKTNSKDSAQPWKFLKGNSLAEGVRVFIIFHCVQTFFWLVGGEVTGWHSRNLVLSLQLPSSTWVGALVPHKNSKVLLCIFLEEEPGPRPITALLLLDCASFFFLHSLPSLISKYLNLPFGTQGRSKRLNEAYFLQTMKWWTQKGFVPGRSPQGPAPFHPYPPNTHTLELVAEKQGKNHVCLLKRSNPLLHF